jgi:hypothetical protein
MPQIMVGLLSAVAAAMSGLVAFAHGSLAWVVIAVAAAAAGLAAFAVAPLQKKPHGVRYEAPNKTGSIADISSDAPTTLISPGMPKLPPAS